VPKPNTFQIEPSGILEIAARRGQSAVLSALLQSKLGVGFPEPGSALVGWVKLLRDPTTLPPAVDSWVVQERSTQPTVSALWIGPERSLLLADPATLAAVREAVSPTRAALIDQTGGYVIWRLAGPDAMRLLVRLCRIDLHVSVFGINHVARTIMAQIPAILHWVDDAPTFRLIVPSTLARSFGASIEHAAMAGGIDLHTKSEPVP
jgi:heterotetrameric sarcosine oxidase gamma subunit